MGITKSVDGFPVNSLRKLNEFLFDSGMYESPGYKEILEWYKCMLNDKEIRDKYHLEIEAFTINYYREKVDEYLAGRNKNESE